MSKFTYSFEEGNASMRSLLGGKGANLAEMTVMGIPVPPGFTISTDACKAFYENKEMLPEHLMEEVLKRIQEVESHTDKKFGSSSSPLLFSVRSGAVFSMPGMMDTILNLGLNDDTVKALAEKTSNERFAFDSYRRFIQMFSDVAMGLPKYEFDDALEDIKAEENVSMDQEISVEGLKKLVGKFKEIYKKHTNEDFPADPLKQLELSIIAVFKSWMNPRAKTYRRLHKIDDNLGTAVNVQSMVFGNMGETSGTGVCFSRSPSNGENKLFGEYLMNAQGEDVVAGIRTPHDIETLKEENEAVYNKFLETIESLEKHYKDMQDVEFTIEEGKLYFLQTRNGKRTGKAALNIAVDMVNEGLLTKEEALLKVEPNQLNQLMHYQFDEDDLKDKEVLTKGLPASPGAASGVVVFSPEDVKKKHDKGIKTILVREETSPEDLEGMVLAEGILTARGGMTSHAAVVARGMGKCCVAGCSELRVDERSKIIRAHNGLEIKEGETISIDGTNGIVYLGEIKKIEPQLSGNFETFMEWADEYKVMGVYTNADTPKDASAARKFGAKGIGLTRTEHMFFDEKRIIDVRKMILAKTTEERQASLDKLLPHQKSDFVGIFEAMKGLPVTIRLLDPPLHEFLPVKESDIKQIASDLGVSYEALCDRIEELKELNPMLGHRGCRLAVSYPEIYKMQTRAIMEAAIEVGETTPHIMIPLVGDIKELEYVKGQIKEEIEKVFEEKSAKIDYEVGTMIEIPRAALLADQIAKEADFFSFGTNDMTQMTFGFSRDDSGPFIAEYVDRGIFKVSPFESLDTEGVGKLIEMATRLGRESNPNLHVGVCGEAGGDPDSIKFFGKVGLDYVSCSPYRVPIARLAAAQSAIELKKQK
uniref:pyruvate, phosphate dikinase n=1 Tax=Ezakiella massiliensis TaxID=1852374 RepID=UPI00094EAC20|nr:pyruvate, phosphate dikinase [Ezakiella massiliensis]